MGAASSAYAPSYGYAGPLNQLGVEVERTSISIAGSICRRSSSIGRSRESRVGSNRSSNYWGLGSVDSSLGIEVLSTSLGHSRLINRYNSTIGVSNELVFKVEGARVAICRSVGSGGSSIGNSRGCRVGIEVRNTSLGHSRLINRDNSTIGVSNELVVKVEGA